MEALANAAVRGVDVKLILLGIPDKIICFSTIKQAKKHKNMSKKAFIYIKSIKIHLSIF